MSLWLIVVHTLYLKAYAVSVITDVIRGWLWKSCSSIHGRKQYAHERALNARQNRLNYVSRELERHATTPITIHLSDAYSFAVSGKEDGFLVAFDGP